LASLADQHGFIIVAPSVGAGKNCWNATPARSGEPAAIVKMVQHVITQNEVDPKRVFAAGASSGACMTNALLAAYPDVFAGGSVLAGVPAGAWMGGNTCGSCNQNPPSKSAAQWGDVVRNAFDYSGERPRVQLWHGTNDNTLNYPNLAAEVAQWTNVHGVGDANATMESGKPKSGWDRTSWTNDAGAVVVESNIGQGQPHDLTGLGLWPDVVRFFALDQDAPSNGGAGGAGGGGAVNGGSGGTGGAPNGAGGVVNPGGGTTTGGAVSTGGSVPSTGGGTSSSVGGSPSGSGTGGSISTGGTSSSPVTGGAPATGGSRASGGTSPSSGGANSAGTNSAPGGSSTTAPDTPADDGGCAYVPGAHRGLGALVALAIAGIGAFARRRRSVG
jgi:poly(hydroxyalkanoate) depolymerase family esterase